MSMMTFYELKDKLCRELDEINEKNDISVTDLDNIFKMSGSIKNFTKIIDHEEMQGGRSGDGNWMAEGAYSNGSRAGTHYTGGYYSRDNGGNSGGRYRDRYSGEEGRAMWDQSMRTRMNSNSYDPYERETMQRAYRNNY